MESSGTQLEPRLVSHYTPACKLQVRADPQERLETAAKDTASGEEEAAEDPSVARTDAEPAFLSPLTVTRWMRVSILELPQSLSLLNKCGCFTSTLPLSGTTLTQRKFQETHCNSFKFDQTRFPRPLPLPRLFYIPFLNNGPLRQQQPRSAGSSQDSQSVPAGLVAQRAVF